MGQPSVFVRAAFPLARCGRGLIYQAQNGCGCAVGDDGAQRDAAGHGMGGGDAITVAGAMNRAPTGYAATVGCVVRAAVGLCVWGSFLGWV